MAIHSLSPRHCIKVRHMATMESLFAGGEIKNDKLAEVAERFKGEWVHGTEVNRRERQDKEDDQIHDLKSNIARLESILNQEVKRRNETNKAIQGAFEAHMATVQDRLEAGLVYRLDTLMNSVGVLNDRVKVVEEEFGTARQSYILDMEDKSTLVADDIVALKSTFTAERAERKERETLIIAKLRDLDERTAEKLIKDRKVLDTQVVQLNEELGVVGHEEDRRFHEFVFTELAALKTGLVQEGQAREQADDEIVLAIKQYTESVQEAIKVVNTASH